MDKILKVAKRLKTFTLEDIVMFCGIDADNAEKFIQASENIKSFGNKFEYVEIMKAEDKFKIIDKNIKSKNSDVTVVDACELFLDIKRNTLTEMSFQAYKTFVYSKIIRIANIPKRQIQILTPEQLSQLFKITNKKYPYLTPIIQNLITLKQPLNTILTGDKREKKHLKRKIRKDFYKVKQKLGLTNYMFDDLRLCNIDNKIKIIYY